MVLQNVFKCAAAAVVSAGGFVAADGANMINLRHVEISDILINIKVSSSNMRYLVL